MGRRQRVHDATDDGARLVESRVVLFAAGPVERHLAATVEERRGLEAEEGTLADLGSAAFVLDLVSMAHETQYTRLFRS